MTFAAVMAKSPYWRNFLSQHRLVYSHQLGALHQRFYSPLANPQKQWRRVLHDKESTSDAAQSQEKAAEAARRAFLPTAKRTLKVAAANPKARARGEIMEQRAELTEAFKLKKQLFDPQGIPLIPSIVLRDACRCSQCVDVSTKQRNFLFANIPTNVRAIPEGMNDSGHFKIGWENDIEGFFNHTSTFSMDELVLLLQGQSSTIYFTGAGNQKVGWDTLSIMERLVKIPYDDYMKNDESLLQAMQALLRDGLALVANVPSSPESVAKLVKRIGPLRNSFYGSTWHVESKPNADNVAYTHKELGFHMDLLYMREVPEFQFLHCIQNTCTGGESRFVDTYQARRIMETEYPEQAEVLHDHLVAYEYKNLGQHYHKKRPVFWGSDTVHWSPPFVGRLSNRIRTLSEFLVACKTFADILERPNLVYETKMEESACVIFQNTRVAHARNAFDVNSGRRRLHGAYLDHQPFLSTYFRLIHQLSDDTKSALPPEIPNEITSAIS